MFETVAPQHFVKKSRRVFYESLPISLLLHAIVIGAVFLTLLWNVSFPDQSPRVMVAYSLLAAPPPPPPPPPPPAAPKAIVQPTQPVEIPKEIVAPTVIPDTIPMVSNQLPKVDTTAGVTGGVEGGIEGGVVGGAIGGVVGGDLGGLVGGTTGGVGNATPVAETIIHIERDKPLPMHPISQVYPIYPNRERLSHLEDSLVVRYLIGTNGRVKEVTVISHAERKVFEEVAVKAIRNWRFRPLIKDGQAKEVEHELTVNFRLEPAS
jgi:protein TonB